MTAQLKMMVDRLFPYITIDLRGPLPKGKRCGLIFTQNQVNPDLFRSHFDMTATLFRFMGFEDPEILVSVDTIGYDGDPEKLAVPQPEKTAQRKRRYREVEFPLDMQKA